MKKILIVLMCFLVCGCSEKIIEDTTGENVKSIMDTVEVYSDIYLNDLIDNLNNVEILSKNKLLDTNTLGKKEVEVEYRFEKKKYVYKFDINVVDSKAPIVFSGTNKTVEVGYDEDICNLISYGDEYDGNITCEIEGLYDLNKVGTYKLVYHLSDSSKNQKDVNVTLNVIKKKENDSTPSTPTEKVVTEFQDVYNKHKKDNTEIGIDVSKWQEDIDYEKVKQAGASFVMMRIGYQGQTTRELYDDEYYASNIRKAKEAGLKVGVYFFTVAGSTNEVKEHAKWVVDKLDGEKLDLPIAFDWENWSKWNSYKLSFHEINEIANTYMDTLEESGYKAMLYSSKFYLETIWKNKKDYPVWLAHYTKDFNTSSYQGKYMMWQVCNNGHIDGINNDVDIDVLYL